MTRKTTFGVLLVGAALLLTACHENGTVFAVDTTNDTVDLIPGDGLCADAAGDCSLRAAVMEANALAGVEKIELTDGAVYQLTIAGPEENSAATGDLDITEAVVITGDATVNAATLDRAFDIRHPAGLVEIVDVDVDRSIGAFRFAGAGITSVQRAELLRQVDTPIVIENGLVYFWQSTIAYASVSDGPVAIAATGGTIDLKNVTITLNTSESGDGVAVGVTDGAAVIGYSTIHRNLDAGSLGLDAGGTGSIVFESSIIGRGRGVAPSCAGAVVSLGYNILGDLTCGAAAVGDVVAPPPIVLPLADNGGPVRTNALAPTSPAIDTRPTNGICLPFGIDANGDPRPSGADCDSGAVEYQQVP